MLAIGRFLTNYFIVCIIMLVVCYFVMKFQNRSDKRTKEQRKKELDDMLSSPYGQILQSYTGDLHSATNQWLMIIALSFTPVVNMYFWARCMTKDKS